MINDSFFRYYILLCIVIISLSGFTAVTINRAQCIDKFDDAVEIKQCMGLVN